MIRISPNYALVLYAVVTALMGVAAFGYFDHHRIVELVSVCFLYFVAGALSLAAFAALKALDRVRALMQAFGQIKFPKGFDGNQ